MNPVPTLRAVTGWTQARLASSAGTSQPTIAAYESGTKSPTWRTVEQLAHAAGLACYPFVGPPMSRDQARSLALHEAIVSRLMADPQTVVAAARRNLAVMRGVNPRAGALLDEWSTALDRPPGELASRMLDPSESARELRQVTPFAGVLTTRQRTHVYRAFRGDT